MAKKTAEKAKNHTDPQGDSDSKASPGNPPKEHQWKPGQSGNPKGCPKRRTNLWVWISKYMAMTDAKLKALDRKELTQVQQGALRIAQKFKTGRGCGSERLAKYIVDREEGKAAEHLIIGSENDLTDDECEQIREQMARDHAGTD